MSHTPAPWRWINYPDGRKLLSARDRAVLHCPDAPIGCDLEDARLIAAAPELLAALIAVVDNIELLDNPSDQGISSHSDTVENCRAAIAKAQGHS